MGEEKTEDRVCPHRNYVGLTGNNTKLKDIINSKHVFILRSLVFG